MKIELNSVMVKSALPEISLSVATGQAAYVATSTDQRPTVLGLVATGRMKITSGEVLVDGEKNRRKLRNCSALIDAPMVSAPVDDVWFLGLVSEELTFAGRWGGLRSVLKWLDEKGMREYARTAAADLPAEIRIKALLELAALRANTDLLVLVSPDRHGIAPDRWWPILTEIADRGFAVLAIVGEPTALLLEQQGALCAENNEIIAKAEAQELGQGNTEVM